MVACERDCPPFVAAIWVPPPPPPRGGAEGGHGLGPLKSAEKPSGQEPYEACPWQPWGSSGTMGQWWGVRGGE